MLGGGEPPLQPVDLALSVARLPGRYVISLLGESVGRPPGLLERLRPGPVELHDLRAMGQAAAAEAHHLGLLLAPARQGRGPFPSPAGLVSPLTGKDHTAVDEPVD